MTRRLLLSYLSITAFVLLIIEVPLGVTFARAERDRLVAAVERDATVLATLVEDSLEAGATSGLDPVASGYQDRTGGRVVVVDRQGVTVADSDPPAPGRRDLSTRPEIAAALRGQHTAGSRSSTTLGSAFLYVAVPVASQGQVYGAVRITYPTAAVDARVRRVWLALAGVAVLVLGVVALVGFAFFVAWELTEKHPVVDLTLFKRRNFWAGTVAISVGYGLFFGNVVLLPLWLQQFMGYTSTQAGFILAPVGLMAIVLSPWVGKNVSKIDPRRFATFAFLVFGLVLWMRSNFNTQADEATIMVPTIIQGVAMAFFFIPLLTITLSGLTPDRIPAASGLSNFVRITAGAFGTSIATTVWENRAALHHAQLSESVNLGSQATNNAMTGLAAAGLTPDQALAQVNRLLDQQAFMLAANDVFYVSALLFLLLIPLVWMARPQMGGAGGGDAASGAH